MTGADMSDLLMLAYIERSEGQGVDINQCTRSERLAVWSLADQGLVKSQAGFYTITDAGRVQLAAAKDGPPRATRGGR